MENQGYNPYNMPLVTRDQLPHQTSSGQLVTSGLNGSAVSQGYVPPGTWETQGGWPNEYDNLDQDAERAKREAQSKRKQIPPFIQKLSR